MARKTVKTKKPRVTQEEVNEAAELAAQVLENEQEGDDMTEGEEGTGISFGFNRAVEDEDYAVDDVFEEAFKKAVALNTAPRFHIKKNSQFLAVKGWPYSWEQLQKEYGEGYYQVIAKSMANGRILKKQSEMVGNPHNTSVVTDEIQEEDSDKEKVSELAYLTMMQQWQERQDQKAREQAKQAENTTNSFWAQIMSSQQQQNQMFMTMLMEQGKQTQNLMAAVMGKPQDNPISTVMPLLTALLTKNKSDDGFTQARVLELIQRAEERAENRANKMHEIIEKKADELAEIKAEAMSSGGDGEEKGGFMSSALKGFIPLLTQSLSQQLGQNPQGIPQQPIDPAYLEQQALRPMVGAARPQVPAQSNYAQPVARPVQKPVNKNGGPLDKNTKDEIFAFVGADIGNALLNRVAGSKTAEVVLDKLEKVGYARQTIAVSFSLEDFYGYAVQYNLPDAVKPWLKEFHEAIQSLSAPKSVHVPAGGVKGPAITVENSGLNGTTNAKPKEPVAAKRGTEPRTSAGTSTGIPAAD